MIHTALLSSCESYAYIMHTLNSYFFPQHRLFLRSCNEQNTKLSKMAGKEEQSCSSCFKNKIYGIRNISVCLVLFSTIMKLVLLKAGKQAVQSHIVSHVSEKLWKSTLRSNVMIKNPAKIEVYRSKRNGLLQGENQ